MKINSKQTTESYCDEIWKFVNYNIKDFFIRNKEDANKLIIQTTPSEILSMPINNTLGKAEEEISARWIFMFLADRDNSFLPFKLEELQAYYINKLGKNQEFWFNGLEYCNVNRDILPCVLIESNICYLSQRFIIFACINGDFCLTNN